MNRKEFPEAIEMKKQLLSAMFMKEGVVVPDVAAIINADNLYRPEHRLVFQAILRLYAKKLRLITLPLRKNFARPVTLAKLNIDICSPLSTPPSPLPALSISRQHHQGKSQLAQVYQT